MTDPAAEREAQTAKEYGQWTALGPIRVDGALAFNQGDPVPASHVERGVVPSELVAKSTTKAAAAAKES